MWSTITGYLLSLDLVGLFTATIDWFKRCFGHNQQSKTSESNYINGTFDVLKPKIQPEEMNSSAVATKKSLILKSGLGMSGRAFEKCMAGFFHITFFIIVVNVVLFVPSPVLQHFHQHVNSSTNHTALIEHAVNFNQTPSRETNVTHQVK